MLDNLNKIEIDQFNRTSAVFAVNKPENMTSHDVVDIVRRKLRTRKVGHAGALDPFATGVLLIMVGKYTKMSMELMGKDKEYKASILLGAATSTQDPEGEITQVEIRDIQQKDLVKIDKIKNGYNQRVPLFSSVKVNGKKLRQLARKAKSYDFVSKDIVKLTMRDDSEVEVELPYKQVNFTKFQIEDMKNVKVSDLGTSMKFKFAHKGIDKDEVLPVMNLTVACSKGTYIRQLAEDIGELLGVPAMLLNLQRTRISDVTLDQCINIEEIPEL